ncbi:MAG: NADH-quinone oxidoreductase subunit C [Chloroflexi bacterium]|nr:NADH-quinone oxidoreductase subunit C [Chloroflexota bacterium]
MTRVLEGAALAQHIEQAVPGAVVRWQAGDVWVHPEKLAQVCWVLKKEPLLAFDYLAAVTAIDYIEHFELVYHLVSIQHNHSAVLKVLAYGREAPTVPSVVEVWQGADLQEREVWDLMGVAFDGHPNLKRILTWEGFPGHPLRKDHLGA